MAENGLSIHPTKTRIVDARTVPFDFLGYTFCGQDHSPRKKSIQKLRDTIREKTRRNNGRSLHCVIVDVNRVLKGWFAYFQHSSRLYVYRRHDSWIRMRLRSLLRRRARRRGHGRGWDHIRWPNLLGRSGWLCSSIGWSACVGSDRLCWVGRFIGSLGSSVALSDRPCVDARQRIEAHLRKQVGWLVVGRARAGFRVREVFWFPGDRYRPTARSPPGSRRGALIEGATGREGAQGM